jgi:hypothetical protein
MCCMLEKQIPHLFCLVVKFGFVLVDTKTLRITDISQKGLRVNPQVPLHNIMVSVWCAMNATKIVRYIVFLNINVAHSLTPFF